MIEMPRLKAVIFFPNNVKFCAVKKNHTVLTQYLIQYCSLTRSSGELKHSQRFIIELNNLKKNLQQIT